MVKEGDRMKLGKLLANEGDSVEFGEVLLVADKEVKIGTPLVEGVKISAKVLKQGRSKKVIVFHYHPKTRYKKKAGHRQHFTQVEIVEIN